MKRKIFSILLSLALVVSMIPAFGVTAHAEDTVIAYIGTTVVHYSDLDENGTAYGDGWELLSEKGNSQPQHIQLNLKNYSGLRILFPGQSLLDVVITAEGENRIDGNGDAGIEASPLNSGYFELGFYVKDNSSIKINNSTVGIHIIHPNPAIKIVGKSIYTSKMIISPYSYGIYMHKGRNTAIAEEADPLGSLIFNNIDFNSGGSTECLGVGTAGMAANTCSRIELHGFVGDNIGYNSDLMRIVSGGFDSSSIVIEPIEYNPYQPKNHTISVTNGYASPSEASAGETVTIHFSVKKPREGYIFCGWSVASGNVTLADKNALTTTFTMPDEDVSITGLYRQGYAISVQGGTADRMAAAANQTVTITADTPPSGKEFDYWKVVRGNAGLADVNSNTTTFSMPSREVFIQAVWKDKEYDPNSTHTVIPDSLNVREGPGTEYGRNGGLHGGDEVQVVETQGEWSKIKYGTGYGWVQSKYLEPIKKLVNPFVDVYESDEYYDAVLWAYYHDPFITNGIDATHFGPKNTVKRCESVTFLWRAMGSPKPSSYYNPFKDVKSSDYFYEPVLWAVEKGITNGTTATTFAPNDTLTTAHMITFLYRTKTGNVGQSGEKWYEDAANWAGNGYGGKPFGVDVVVNNWTPCPRANVVMFLQKAL